MNNTGYISLSRQAAIRRHMDVIANNIANATTPAFKAERVMFAEYVGKGAGVQRMSFVYDVGVTRDSREGTLVDTGNVLDLAIKGPGYFAIQTASGETLYTRNGRFRLDDTGKIVTSQGQAVLDEQNRPISVPASDSRIEITRDGALSTESGVAGRLKIVRFDDEQSLRPIADGLLKSDKPPQPATDSLVVQGMLEDSNVRPVVEITNMIDAMRSYQNAQQMVQNEHERMLKTIDTFTRTN